MKLDAYCAADGRGWDYEALLADFDWARAMAQTPQDPRHHGEGDVWTHTRMVCEAVVADPFWTALDADAQRVLLTAALLHDVGKPDVTFTDAHGRIRSPGHAVRGEALARRVLWRLEVPFRFREHAAALVRHHMQPRYLPSQRDSRRRAWAISQVARCDLLAALARGDALGRVSADSHVALREVDRFIDVCGRHDCLTKPRAFTSDHARFLYFQRRLDDPDAVVAPPEGPTLTVMSGLPASGKDTWVAANRGARPVISLDEIRLELGVSPVDEQEPVVRLAHERARSLLGDGRDIIWNATTLSRRHRRTLLELAAPFDARIESVHADVPPSLLFPRNRARPAGAVVPVDVIWRMTNIWQPPDLTEAHAVAYVTGDAMSEARRRAS